MTESKGHIKLLSLIYHLQFIWCLLFSGFLTTEDGIIPGNLGLKDQHFAIRWVKNNIKLFGGNPRKITLAGQSAGASSVGFQTISRRNKGKPIFRLIVDWKRIKYFLGLFRGAILESGSALCQWSHQKYARFYAFELGRSLDSNFTSNESSDLLSLLLNASASEINNNAVTVSQTD